MLCLVSRLGECYLRCKPLPSFGGMSLKSGQRVAAEQHCESCASRGLGDGEASRNFERVRTIVTGTCLSVMDSLRKFGPCPRPRVCVTMTVTGL